MIDKSVLPEHWEVRKLGEICKTVTGNTPPRNNIDNYGTAIPFVKPPQVQDKPISDAPENLSEKGTQVARVLPIGSVLVTCIGNLGRTAINKIPVAFNQQINALIPSKVLEGKFLFYQAQSPNFKNQLEKLSAATTVAIVNKGKFETINIVLPTLPEQRGIVAKLEELFSDLDKGKEQLETARQQLKVYRQAVLKWAFEGRFTNPEVKEGELPEGWKWVKIGNISPKVTVGFVGSMKDQYIDQGIPFLRGQNVKANRYDPNGLKYVSDKFHIQLSKSKISTGDILVVRSGNVGTSCVVPESLPDANCSDLVIVKKPTNTNSYYISYYLNSVVQSRIIAQKVGVALGHFNTKTVERFEIPVPDLEEQIQIVQEIESRLSVCDKVEETINQSLQQADMLRQSILKEAFEGKLIKISKTVVEMA
ncbi:restriction endonuclease subunit S [Pontibacter beigongshangensis]|uniref:restriction endonuclease subunit S n=1 Tax=Pontibacter beigongshangensis TaxID=2574733 RepID=UPI00164F251F|nr:restriction endonuclease subunit S [Pontibacter beigongshangensis]